jgi:sacsin
VTLVHPNVPSSTAEALGIPTLMSKMLEAEELDYSFGQSDSLTHRLSSLLDEYSDGFAIPKELVQNADDAGKSSISIITFLAAHF